MKRKYDMPSVETVYQTFIEEGSKIRLQKD